VTPLPLPDGPPKRVAVVRLSAIGDTVRALPLVTSIKRAWPETHLTWVIQPAALPLWRGHPDVDEFLVFRRSLGARAHAEFRRRVRDRRFDLVVCVHPCFKAAVVTRLLAAPFRLGYDRARARDLSWLATNHRIPARVGVPAVQHVQEDYFEFLEFLGLPVHAEWDFHFTAAERREQIGWLESMERPVLAVVTRSTDSRKDWTLERTARVLDIAAGDLGFQTVLVGGGSAGELDDARRLRELCRVPPAVELRYDLRRLAWLLDGADVLLAPDTGPLHIAVALGTPSIGLYGFTDPRRDGPYGRFEDLVLDRYPRMDVGRPPRRARAQAMERIEEVHVVEKLQAARERYLTNA